MIHGNMIRGLMTNISDLLGHLQQSSFRDLAGARVSARIPVARSLVNALVARALAGSSAPVKTVDVQPQEGDRLNVTVAVSWPFVPALTIGVTIERQPAFPESPILVLHWSLLGGLGAIASKFVSALDRLPPGIRLDGQFIVLDIPVLAAGSPAAAALRYVRKMEMHTTEGRVVLEVDLEV
jgi:hypothetical protein